MNEFPRYAIAIFPDEEDGDYIAIVPDLKGCSAFGDTPEDALREILGLTSHATFG